MTLKKILGRSKRALFYWYIGVLVTKKYMVQFLFTPILLKIIYIYIYKKAQIFNKLVDSKIWIEK